MNIRLATDKDIDTILETFECAKKYMRASGNSSQWNGSYPDRGQIGRASCRERV